VAFATSSDRDILTELDDRPGAEMTARLLLALTALYIQRPTHTGEEQQQYIELALRLIDKVEAATRTAVARILQRHPNAPAEVVERLGGRQCSRDGGPEGELTRDQYSAGDQPFEGNLHLADREWASTPPPRDTPAGRQLAITPEFGGAFFAASAEERRRLLSLVERGCCDDVEAASEDSERCYGKVDTAALPGQIGEFAREFGQLIDIPTGLCERMLNDPSGEPMVVAAKATGMPIAMLQRILLLVSASASYSVERVYDLTELYHRLDDRSARNILALWRTQAKPNDPIPETGPDTADRRLGAPRPPPYPPPHAGEGRVGVSLRARFGALTGRLQAVNARADRESVARRGLRSR